MTQLAPTLEAYFTLRLIGQRQASPHTVASYRDAFKLLLAFAAQQAGRPPSRLQLEDLDAKLIGAFLDHLETERANAVRTRNARLAALHSMFRFAALRHPGHAALIARVLAIPPKRTERAIVQFLSEDEIDALLASPDRSRWIGRRDHALLLVAIETGLRVSELAGLRCRDVVLGSGAHVRCFGKGRKERVTPLTAPTVAVLRAWLQESSWGLAAWGSRETWSGSWCGWSRAGVAGDRCAARAPGRRRDRFQGGRRGQCCPAGSSVSGVISRVAGGVAGG